MPGGQVHLHVPGGAQSASLANLLEQKDGQPLQIANFDAVTVPVHPYPDRHREH
jgi:hypothetical protein